MIGKILYYVAFCIGWLANASFIWAAAWQARDGNEEKFRQVKTELLQRTGLTEVP